MIILQNPGLIDPLTITTLGVSVKESENPIGFFGTGLKYSIAVLLRNGCSITIHAGPTAYSFTTEQKAIRGKDFSVVLMNGEPLGFTTDLGRNWEVWMALRELYSNMKDEGGTWGPTASGSCPSDRTQIILEGEAVEQAYASRSKWLLLTNPLYAFPSLSIHTNSSQSTAFFYQGIKVGDFTSIPRFTYNVTSPITLTEDRTARSLSNYCEKISASLIKECDDETLLNTLLLLPPANTIEGRDFFRFFLSSPLPSETFLRAITRLAETHKGTVNRNALSACSSYIPKGKLKGLTPTAFEQGILDRSVAFLAALDFKLENPITIVESLGNHWIEGIAEDGVIYLPKAVFDKGTAYVAATLLEEHLHCTKGLLDESRAMQDFLLQKLISFGQQMLGKAL